MKIAVITGITGFLGSELAKQLLDKSTDYHVRGIVRDSKGKRSMQLLEALSAHSNRLELVEVPDIASEKDDCLEAAFTGASLVFHCASPFAIVVDDQQAQLIDVAVRGTRNAMLAAIKNRVERVVVTSSMAACHDCHQKQKPVRPDGVWSEEDWNTTSSLELKDPPEGYWMSKVLAEKEAWKLAEGAGIKLSTILPEFIMGPALTPTVAEASLSCSFFKGFLEAKAKDQVPSGDWLFSDVRDVARAHIAAATSDSGIGKRFIVSSISTSINAHEVSRILTQGLPSLSIIEGKESEVKVNNLDNTRVTRELGMTLIPIDKTLVDMAQSLIKLLGLNIAQKQN
jgi:nucleoside-diphosphate-sugar epimerase